LIGLPALCLAIVNFVLRERSDRDLENLRGENARQITALRAELERVSSEAKTKFDWLHVERARAIIELYGAVVELNIATGTLLTPGLLGPAETHAKQIEDRWKRVNEAGSAYRNLYPKLSIFFTPDIGDAFRVLDDLYWGKVVTAGVFGKFETKQDLEQMIKAMDTSKVDRAIADLKAKLQVLLGVIRD
jgi:hypothetical protein